MSSSLKRMKLDLNPFDPTGAGMPVSGELWISPKKETKIKQEIKKLQGGRGAKVITIVGSYGTGKTCLLRWLQREIFPSMRIESFYFDNPGVQFYDLANRLLRTIGRKDFAKLIWELAGSYVDSNYQGDLFSSGYEEFIFPSNKRRTGNVMMEDLAQKLQGAIIRSGVTSDEEIAYCLARMVIDIPKKPYFTYQDFISGKSGNLVAEGEEAPYFSAVLKTIRLGKNADGVAFLIDEFEEIGLERRLTKRAAHGYLATLKRLINMTQDENDEQKENNNFWLILSMTEDAHERTIALEPALGQRLAIRLDTDILNHDEAKNLVYSRISSARIKNSGVPNDDIFPFPNELPFRAEILGVPRCLVKICFRAIADADGNTQLPFSDTYLQNIEHALYPAQ